jgi:hypothetical protein
LKSTAVPAHYAHMRVLSTSAMNLSLNGLPVARI